ncbi:MAG TPA: type II CAAX endopeptidase family protein, partial [Propionibacteriaceae bacterium]|nr:type II CAAX endopeptidase family protein [Propionibacteriaceae bacterium]
ATPVFFLSNNVGLALLIPVSLLLGWWLFGQRPKWLSSVVGGIRWGWLLRCTLVLLPLWIVYLAFDSFMIYRADGTLGLEANGDTWLLLLGILLTTPFQAAGEEYAFRGFLARSASSFFPWSKVGLIVSMIFSSTLFMFAHGAGDPWLNLFYFSFGLVASIMTWWTGGLEAAIAMHVVNNVLSELVLPFQDISGMFDRSAGVADAQVLIGVAVPMVGLGLIMWQAKRHHIVRTSAPARGQDQLPGGTPPHGPPGAQQWPTPPPPAPRRGPFQDFPPPGQGWRPPPLPPTPMQTTVDDGRRTREGHGVRRWLPGGATTDRTLLT